MDKSTNYFENSIFEQEFSFTDTNNTAKQQLNILLILKN